MHVAARVLGNGHTITLSGAAGGQFQLNIMIREALDPIRMTEPYE
jgi:fumarate hydratase class II